MNTPTNIHMATDLFEGKKVHILSESGSVDLTGVCKFIKSISFYDREDPTVTIDLGVTSSISFSVESPISLIRLVED
jgi:hypothetical protein